MHKFHDGCIQSFQDRHQRSGFRTEPSKNYTEHYAVHDDSQNVYSVRLYDFKIPGIKIIVDICTKQHGSKIITSNYGLQAVVFFK